MSTSSDSSSYGSTDTIVATPSLLPSLLPPKLLSVLTSSISRNERHEIDALLQVLFFRLDATTRSLDSLPSYVRDSKTFQGACVRAIFIGRTFQTKAEKQRASKEPRWRDLNALIPFVENSFKELQAVAQHLMVNKPLPEVPISNPDFSDSSSTLVDDSAAIKRCSTWTTSTVTELLWEEARKIGDTAFQPLGLRDPKTLTLKTPQDALLSKRRLLQQLGFIRKKKRDTRRNGVIFKGSFAVVNSDDSDTSSAHVDLPFVLRESAACGLNDNEFPSPSDEDVPPSSDLQSGLQFADRDKCLLSHASVTGLVHLVTSTEALVNPRVADFFFLTFRFYLSPVDFVRVLRKKCREDVPDGLPETETARRIVQVLSMKLRVAKLIRVWLDQFWKPEHDNKALPRLEKFVVRDLMSLVHDGLMAFILKGIENAKAKVDIRKKFRQDYFDLISSKQKAPAVAPTNLQLDLLNLSMAKLTASPDGAIELGRQLTQKAFEYFGQMDPEDFVYSVVTGRTDYHEKFNKADAAYSDSLARWVQSSILSDDDKITTPRTKNKEIIAALNFWTIVGTECLRLNDFASAYSIYGGLFTSNVMRLTKLIPTLPPECQARAFALQDAFDMSGQFANYRARLAKAREDGVPFVPLLSQIKQGIFTGTAKDQISPSSEGDMVCMAKCNAAYQAIISLEAAYVPYNLPTTHTSTLRPWIDKNLARLQCYEPDAVINQLRSMSLEIEPKGNNNPTRTTLGTTANLWTPTSELAGKQRSAMRSKLSLLSYKIGKD